MGLMDKVKGLFGSKQVQDIADKLGLDDAAVGVFDNLVEKLGDLFQNGKLTELAGNALNAFKPALNAFKADGSGKEDLLAKGKNLLGSLQGVELPDEISGLVEKVKGFLG